MNVLLVVMDSVRAQNTGICDHRHDTTPFLDEFEATVYTQARAPGNWSVTSHASMFTGLHAKEHGLNSRDKVLTADTIFDELGEEGYSTGVFSSNPFITTDIVGMSSPFDEVVGKSSTPYFESALDPNPYRGRIADFVRDSISHERTIKSLGNGLVNKLSWDYPQLLPTSIRQEVRGGTIPGPYFTDKFLEWKEKQDTWAACINYMDAHHPYVPDEEHNRWADDEILDIHENSSGIPFGLYDGTTPWWKYEVAEFLYDGAIRQVDAEIRRLLSNVDLDDTLVIVTSDHGEAFGERSRVRGIKLAAHNIGAEEVNFHVPLYVKHPDDDREVVTDLVSLTDIPEMIRAGPEYSPSGPVLSTGDGISDNMEKLADRPDADRFAGDVHVAYRSGDHAIEKDALWNGDVYSFDIPDGRREPRERVRRDFGRLSDKGAARSEGALDDGVRQQLEELGYR